MDQVWRQRLVVVLAAATVFLTNLGGPSLWDEDEPKNAECAREMQERGDWIVPTFNASLRTDKPILLYWLMRSAYAAFGVSEFSARIASAVLGMGTVLLTFQIGRMLYPGRVAMWSGLVLAGSLMFGVSSRAATPDATLIFCTTLSLFLYIRAISAQFTIGDVTKKLATCAIPTWLHSVGIAAAMGLAVLAKGPSGVILPLGVIGVFVLCLRQVGQNAVSCESSTGTKWTQQLRECCWVILRTISPRNVLWTAWSLRPVTMVLVVCAIALPWYVAVGVKTEGQWLIGFLGTHNVSRFVSAMEGHSGPIFYYVIAVMLGMLPWSLFLPQAIVTAVARVRCDAGRNWNDLFVLCWAGVYLGFFSLARTKLPSYVLPCYPALALLVGHLVDRWVTQPGVITRKTLRVSLAIGCVVGIAFCIALPIVAHFILPGEGWLGLAGLIPLVGCGLVLYFAERSRNVLAASTFACMSIALATTLFAVVSCRVDDHQNCPDLAAMMRGNKPAPDGDDSSFQVATFDFFRPTLVYYARQPVQNLQTADAVRDFLAKPQAFIVTRSDALERIKEVLPEDVSILSSKRLFLRRRHDVLLLGRQPAQIAGASHQKRL